MGAKGAILTQADLKNFEEFTEMLTEFYGADKKDLNHPRSAQNQPRSHKSQCAKNSPEKKKHVTLQV